MSKINEYEKKLESNPTLRRMHLPEGENIWTSHQIRKQKTSFHLKTLHVMDCQPISTDSDLFRYRSKVCPYHGLHRSFFTTKTPDIRVKDEFREEYTINFCADLFINMINEAQLEFNNTELHSFNTVVLKEWKVDNLTQTAFYELGNYTHLTSPSSHLRATKISFFPPWTYSQGKSMYFPLQLCGDRDDLDHKLDFDLDLSKLIIMKKDGVRIPFDKSKLEIVGNVDKISVPQLTGEYTTLTTNECKQSVCLGAGDAPADYFVKNIYYSEDDEKKKLGKKVTIRFDSKKTDPVSKVIWGAVNVTQSEKMQDKIFTIPPLASIEDGTSGGDSGVGEDVSPVKISTLISSVDTVFKNLDSHVTETILRSQTDETPICGINIWKNSILLQEDDRKFSPSITYDGGELNFTLNDGEGDDEFIGFCIMERTTCFRFTSYPKTEDERKSMVATIKEIN